MVVLGVSLTSREDAVFDVLIARQIMFGARPTPETKMRGNQYGRALPHPV